MRKRRWRKRYVGHFAIFWKSINLVLDNFIIFSQISPCLRGISRKRL